MIDNFNINKSNWKLVKLGDVVEEINLREGNPSTSEYKRFVGLEHFISGNLKIKDWKPTDDLVSAAKVFQSGDILFARRNAYLKRASMVEFDGLCSGDAFVLREDHTKIEPGYLSFIVNSDSLWEYANSNAAGTMSKRVKWRDLAEYEFLLPPKDQQAKIAELLWAMDDVVEKENMLLNKNNIFKRILFNELHLLRENSCKNLSELCTKITSGGTPNRQSKNDYFRGHIPWVKSKELNDWIISDTEEYLSDTGIKNSSAKLYPPNTILVAMYGVTVGKIGIIDREMTSNQACCALIIDDTKMDRWFLFYYLFALRKRLKALSVGSAQPNISLGIIKKLKIPYLTLAEQKIYSNKLKVIDQNSLSLISRVNVSKQLQKSLINEMFSS